MWSGISFRDTGRSMRFGPVDARVLGLLLVFFYHWAWWTFGLCVVGAAILGFIEWRGYTIPNALRRVSAWLAGPYRPATNRRRQGRSDR